MGLLVITHSINLYKFPRLYCQFSLEYQNFSPSLRLGSTSLVFSIDLCFVHSLLGAFEKDHQVAIRSRSLNCGQNGLGVPSYCSDNNSQRVGLILRGLLRSCQSLSGSFKQKHFSTLQKFPNKQTKKPPKTKNTNIFLLLSLQVFHC